MNALRLMQALDLDADRTMRQRRNRLEVARDVVEEFVKKRPNDQVGLVVFGDQAFTQCPLTLDHGVLLSLLDRVEIGMAGATRTAVGSALGTAVKRLRDSQAKSKIVVLLTDGRSNAGSLTPLKAAAIAETFDVKVYTIGAGTRGKAPFLTDSAFGQRVLYQDVEIDALPRDRCRKFVLPQNALVNVLSIHRWLLQIPAEKNPGIKSHCVRSWLQRAQSSTPTQSRGQAGQLAPLYPKKVSEISPDPEWGLTV